MPVNLAMSVLTVLECVLWCALGYVFWSKKLNQRYPMMGRYVALHVFGAPVLAVVLQLQAHAHSQGSMVGFFTVYFFLYWGIYLASAVLLLFVCVEMFRSALSGFSGLMRFGSVIFRWAAILCVISCLATISYHRPGFLIITDLAAGLMRAVSLVELGLLAFLCLAMNALQISPKNLCFGVTLGFGILSSSDFIWAMIMPMWTNFQSRGQFVNESITLLVLALWAVYAVVPEPARKPVVLSANSTIYRWNEIASALGTKGTNVVTVPQHAAASFFLTDVEKVVDKVLAKNLTRSES